MLLRKMFIALRFLGGSIAFAQNIVHQTVNPNRVIPVHTALDHISIIICPRRLLA